MSEDWVTERAIALWDALWEAMQLGGWPRECCAACRQAFERMTEAMQAAVREEREACARVAERLTAPDIERPDDRSAAGIIAAAIRHRGEGGST